MRARDSPRSTDLVQLYSAVDLPRLKDRPLSPASRWRPSRARRTSVSAIREGDILVHHPYQSFDVVTRSSRRPPTIPACWPSTDALPVSPTSPIAQALTARPQRRQGSRGRSSSCGPGSTRRPTSAGPGRWKKSGAHVVYGLIGFKTHCKACLVVRQEADGIRRYCHLATGNYNARTGGIYADLGLFTCREGVRRGPHRDLQPPDRLHAPAALQPPARGADRAAGRAGRRRSGARPPTPGRADPRASSRR